MRKHKSGKGAVYMTALAVIIIVGGVYKLLFAQDYSGVDSKAGFVRESEICESTGYETITSNALSGVETFPPVTSQVVYVYICGAVVNPGVYELEDGLLLNDAVNMAGGLSADAAVNNINLVMTIRENITVYIPTEEEVNASLYEGETIIGDEERNSETAGQLSDDGTVNINLAGKEQLMSIPGIGEVTAEAIIEYRTDNGQFTSIEDIMNVSGIGEGKFERMRDYICV